MRFPTMVNMMMGMMETMMIPRSIWTRYTCFFWKETPIV